MLILIELANLWGLNESMFIKYCFKNFLVGVTERHHPPPPHMALTTNQSLILSKFLPGNWSNECIELTQCGMWPPTGEGGWCQSSRVEGPHSSVDGGFPINIEEPLPVVTLSLYTLAHHRDVRSHAIRSELHTIQVTHPTSSFYEGIVVRVKQERLGQVFVHRHSWTPEDASCSAREGEQNKEPRDGMVSCMESSKWYSHGH